MSQQDASATHPYRGLVARCKRSCSSQTRLNNPIFVDSGAKNQRAVLPRRKKLLQRSAALLETCLSSMQQDIAPAHRARDTVELLRRETPQFISPDISDMWPCSQ